MKRIQLVLWLLIIIYIVYFSYLSLLRYNSFSSHYYDLGIMNQVVYNTSRGRILQMTDQQLKKNINRMAVHFDPILAFFAPLYKIYQGPETLLITQTIIVALGAWAVFLIAEKILKKKPVSLLFALVYLLYFPVERANLFDFHAVVLATTFILFSIYFYLVRKNLWYFIFIFLALLTKEHVGLVVVFFGLYEIFIDKNKKIGLITTVFGLIFFVASIYIIIPYFRQENHFALRYFESFGDSPTKIFYNLARHPFVTLRLLFNKDAIGYILRLSLPMFYAIFSPLTVFISIPEIAINILSINDNMRSIYFHYSALIVPFIIFGAILGFQNFDKYIKNRTVKNLLMGLFVLINIYSFYLYSPARIKILKQPIYIRDNDSSRLQTVLKWENKLRDENIKLATTPILAPYFTERKYYYNFLYDPAYASMGYTDEDVIASNKDIYKLADFVIIDRSEIGDLNKGGSLPVKFYQNFRNDINFSIIFSDNRGDKSIEVYKRINN